MLMQEILMLEQGKRISMTLFIVDFPLLLLL